MAGHDRRDNSDIADIVDTATSRQVHTRLGKPLDQWPQSNGTAQAFGDLEGVSRAVMTDVDSRTMRLIVESNDGPHALDIPLDHRARSRGEMRSVLVVMVKRARQVLGGG